MKNDIKLSAAVLAFSATLISLPSFGDEALFLLEPIAGTNNSPSFQIKFQPSGSDQSNEIEQMLIGNPPEFLEKIKRDVVTTYGQDFSITSIDIDYSKLTAKNISQITATIRDALGNKTIDNITWSINGQVLDLDVMHLTAAVGCDVSRPVKCSPVGPLDIEARNINLVMNILVGRAFTIYNNGSNKSVIDSIAEECVNTAKIDNSQPSALLKNRSLQILNLLDCKIIDDSFIIYDGRNEYKVSQADLLSAFSLKYSNIIAEKSLEKKVKNDDFSNNIYWLLVLLALIIGSGGVYGLRNVKKREANTQKILTPPLITVNMSTQTVT